MREKKTLRIFKVHFFKIKVYYIFILISLSCNLSQRAIGWKIDEREKHWTNKIRLIFKVFSRIVCTETKSGLASTTGTTERTRNRSETRLKENSRFSPFTLGTAKLPRRSRRPFFNSFIRAVHALCSPNAPVISPAWSPVE